MRRISLLCIIILVVFMSGCFSPKTIVPLRYTPVPMAKDCTYPTTVVLFSDARPDPIAVGRTYDGATLYGDMEVVSWASWALYEELNERGCKASFKDHFPAQPHGRVITGRIEQLNLNRSSITDGQLIMRVLFQVYENDKKILELKRGVTMEKTDIPTNDISKDMLTEGLHDILNSALAEIL
ncbi:MAG: hypothetical protein ACNI27_13735 [Desulfovibrio sp.]